MDHRRSPLKRLKSGFVAASKGKEVRLQSGEGWLTVSQDVASICIAHGAGRGAIHSEGRRGDRHVIRDRATVPNSLPVVDTDTNDGAIGIQQPGQRPHQPTVTTVTAVAITIRGTDTVTPRKRTSRNTRKARSISTWSIRSAGSSSGRPLAWVACRRRRSKTALAQLCGLTSSACIQPAGFAL